MMLQFEAFELEGRYCLFSVDVSRYDFYLGFRRLIKVLS